MPDGEKPDAMGELREGFDEIYGNMEGFSKRTVSSLFEEDEPKPSAGSERKSEPKNSGPRGGGRNGGTRPPRPSRAESAARLSGSADSAYEPGRPSSHSNIESSVGASSGRPSRSDRADRLDRHEPEHSHTSSSYSRGEADPDEAYARYIRTAEQANRMDIAKQRADRAQALMERDEKLNEVSYISKRREDTVARARNMEETDLYMSGRGGGRQLNIRNIAAVCALLVLIVCAILTWQMLAARFQLAAMADQVERMSELEEEVDRLRILNNGLEGNVADLERQLADSQERATMFENILGPAGGPDDTSDENADTTTDATADVTAAPTAGDLPHTTLNAQGQRVYTVQPNDTLWAIAMRVYNDGSRHRDIQAANNLTDAQASGITVGQVLIIPD